jgi:5-formyltetrahydrofolate cyclo-ligase
MEKSELRQRILKARTMMDVSDAASLSVLICDKLLALDCVKAAACIMAYCTYKNEPDLTKLIDECLELGKTVALPYIAGKGELIAVRYESDSVMKSNIYGIPEPVLKNDSEEEEPDVVMVPGIAFDGKLCRVGFGGGYYDRFLASVNTYKIGVCFDYQVVDDIACDAHDVPMDIVLTEKRIIGGVGCV